MIIKLPEGTFGNVLGWAVFHCSMNSIVSGGRIDPAFPLRYGKNEGNMQGGCGKTITFSVPLCIAKR